MENDLGQYLLYKTRSVETLLIKVTKANNIAEPAEKFLSNKSAVKALVFFFGEGKK